MCPKFKSFSDPYLFKIYNFEYVTILRVANKIVIVNGGSLLNLILMKIEETVLHCKAD